MAAKRDTEQKKKESFKKLKSSKRREAMIRGYTFFNRSTGVEIREYEKTIKDTKEGKVRLRFFTTDGSKKNLIFMLDPDEAFVLGCNMEKVVRNGDESFSLYHSFTAPGGEEVSSRLICEKWERKGKSGFSLIIVRGQERINVSFDEGRFLYAADLLKFLSRTASWWEFIGEEREEAEETQEAQETEETQKSKEDPFETEEIKGEIQAVARSGQAFKVNNSWVNLKETTKIQGKIEKGKQVKALVSKSEGRIYAEEVKVK